MKRIFKKSALVLATLMILLLSTYSCNDLLNNPLKDKDTGEDITLLEIDPGSIFKTTFTINLIDVQTNEPLDSSQAAHIYVGGADSISVCSISGKKLDHYSTENGSLELWIDPARAPSESNPIELTLKADIDGYEGLTTTVNYSSEGAKTITLYVLKNQPADDDEEEELGGEFNENTGEIIFGSAISNGLKSASTVQATARPYTFTFGSSSFDNLLKFKNKQGKVIFTSKSEILAKYIADPNNFAKITIGYSTINRIQFKFVDGKKTMFTTFERVYIKKMTLAGEQVGSFNGANIGSTLTWDEVAQASPDLFGWWDNTKSRFTGIETAFTGFTNLKYTAWANYVDLCNIGANINFKSTSKVNFNFEASFYDNFNKKLGSAGFSGIFDQTFGLENVSNEPATIKFSKNYFTYEAIPDIQVSTLCSGDINVNVVPKSGYEVYEIALTALCKDNPTVGISPTYSALYKPVGDPTAPWQPIKMQGGVFKVLAKPNTLYQFKLNFDGAYEYIDINTDFTKNEIGSDTKIEYKGKVNGIHIVKIKHLFKQSVCNDLGW